MSAENGMQELKRSMQSKKVLVQRICDGHGYGERFTEIPSCIFPSIICLTGHLAVHATSRKGQDKLTRALQLLKQVKLLSRGENLTPINVT